MPDLPGRRQQALDLDHRARRIPAAWRSPAFAAGGFDTYVSPSTVTFNGVSTAVLSGIWNGTKAVTNLGRRQERRSSSRPTRAIHRSRPPRGRVRQGGGRRRYHDSRHQQGRAQRLVT